MGSQTCDRTDETKYVPFRTCRNFVEVLSALLAKVFVWAGSFVHDAHASAVLPYLADIALDEKTAELVSLRLQIGQRHASLECVGWQARVILIATHASGDFVFLCYVVFELVVELGGLVLVIIVLACSAACQGRLGLCIVRGLLGVFRGERVWSGRLWR